MNSVFPRRLSAVTSLLLWSSPLLRAGPAESLIQQGDVYYAKLQAPEALKYYLPAEKLEPKNVRLLVRISREYRHLMSDATKSEDKVRLCETAVSYAKTAAAIEPNDPEAQLAVAISYGKLQPLVGTGARIATSRLIKEAADKTIKLDPRSDLGWHVLGRWHLVLAEVGPVKRALAQAAYGKLPESTYEEAAACFEKAMELNPNRLMHYIELGRTYQDMGRTAEARRLITTGLGMKDTEKDDPETKQEGRELLAKMH